MANDSIVGDQRDLHILHHCVYIILLSKDTSRSENTGDQQYDRDAKPQ